MLNTDICMAFPMSTLLPPTQDCGPNDLPDGAPGCIDPDSGAIPTTADLVATYANDVDTFLSDFSAAFTKMTCVGFGVPAVVDGATSTGRLGTLTSIDLTTCPA